MAAKSKKLNAAPSAVEAFDAGDGGSDPDVPVRPGTGTTPSVYMHLESKEAMGWTLFTKEKDGDNPKITFPDGIGTIILIADDSAWKLEEDAITEKMYLDIENAKLTGISMEGLVDEMGNDVPAKQNCKAKSHYEIKMHFKKPAK